MTEGRRGKVESMTRSKGWVWQWDEWARKKRNREHVNSCVVVSCQIWISPVPTGTTLYNLCYEKPLRAETRFIWKPLYLGHIDCGYGYSTDYGFIYIGKSNKNTPILLQIRKTRTLSNVKCQCVSTTNPLSSPNQQRPEIIRLSWMIVMRCQLCWVRFFFPRLHLLGIWSSRKSSTLNPFKIFNRKSLCAIKTKFNSIADCMIVM